jgi:hypothetical protein
MHYPFNIVRFRGVFFSVTQITYRDLNLFYSPTIKTPSRVNHEDQDNDQFSETLRT